MNYVIKKSMFFMVCISFLCVGCQNHHQSAKEKLANQIEQYLNNCYADSIFNGVVLVSVDNEIILEDAWGYQNINSKIKNSFSTIFNLASITKPFTAAAIFILQSEEKLNIKNYVNKYIPEFPYPQMTIENLLTHTSGIPDYTHIGQLIVKLRQSGSKSMTNKDIVEWIVNGRPDLEFQSGSESRYCNTNYVLLAEIIESVSGMSYKKFMQEKIFDKLDMKNSFVITPSDSIDRSRFAIGFRNSLYGDSKVDHITSHDGFYDEILGDGGIFMSAGDLNKFSRALHFGILKDVIPKTAFHAFTLSNGEKGKYACGWFVGVNKNRGYIKHGGNWGGYLSNYYHIPDDNINIIILTNNTMSPYSMDDLTDGIIDILSGNIPNPVRQPISRILPEILSTQGADAAVREYYKLKQTVSDRYLFLDRDLFGLGITLFYNDEFENAAVIFKLTADEYPDYPDTYEYLADSYRELKQPKLAQEYYKKAMEVDPDRKESISEKMKSLLIE